MYTLRYEWSFEHIFTWWNLVALTLYLIPQFAYIANIPFLECCKMESTNLPVISLTCMLMALICVYEIGFIFLLRFSFYKAVKIIDFSLDMAIWPVYLLMGQTGLFFCFYLFIYFYFILIGSNIKGYLKGNKSKSSVYYFKSYILVLIQRSRLLYNNNVLYNNWHNNNYMNNNKKKYE